MSPDSSFLPSGIYRGWVRHRRRAEQRHDFRYPLAMVLLDLDDLVGTFNHSPWWSLERFNLISFKHQDYLQTNTAGQGIAAAVKHHIKEATGCDFSGCIQLLTHPRYFGFVMNPVSFYFCSDQGQLEYIVAEINNTPWDERHSYVLPVEQGDGQTLGNSRQYAFNFAKDFHVSPFMPMDLDYQWRFTVSDQTIRIHMNLLRKGEKVFDATMQGEQEAFNARNMLRLPIQYPLQTVAVVARIYWHALRLWLKGVSFFSHPKTLNPSTEKTGERS